MLTIDTIDTPTASPLEVWPETPILPKPAFS